MPSPNHNERERRFRAWVWRIVLLIVVAWGAVLIWGGIELVDLLWNMGD